MTLSESVAKLQTLLPVLKSGDAKFASDLIASFKKYGGLTPKQEPWIGKLILRAEAPVPVFSAPLAAPAAISVGGFEGVVALFVKAKEHLKFPKISLLLNGTTVVLSLNGQKSKNPGHVTIQGLGKYPHRTFYGRVSPEGQFFAGHIDPAIKSALIVLLTQFASHPARVAKEHGKLTGNCCFCNKVLGLGEDKRSVLVGFGPVCAEHYGLKAEWLSGVAKAEAKASVVDGLANVVEPVAAVLTPSPEQALDTVAQHAEAAEDLAESLAKATGAVSVTVNDGEVTAIYTKPVVNPDELQAELGPENSAPKNCFFCEQPAVNFKTLHGLTVCANCVSQLV